MSRDLPAVEKKASIPIAEPKDGFMTVKQLRAKERKLKAMEYDRIVE